MIFPYLISACACVTTPCRPDLLVRAARHYEGAGQVLLQRAVMYSRKFISIGQGEVPPLEVWQEVEVPARLDLAGEEDISRSRCLELYLLID